MCDYEPEEGCTRKEMPKQQFGDVCSDIRQFVHLVRRAESNSRPIVVAVGSEGIRIGAEDGELTVLSCALFDVGTQPPALLCIAVLDVKGLTLMEIGTLGLAEVLKSKSILKIFFDCRKASVALHAQFQVRPHPVFDLQLCDVAVRDDSIKERHHRLTSSLHHAVCHRPHLKHGLHHCVKLNSLVSSLAEHNVALPAPLLRYAEEAKNDQPDLLGTRPLSTATIERAAAKALLIFALFQNLQQKYQLAKAAAWKRIPEWSNRYVHFYTVLQVDVGAPFDSHSFLPLGVLPRTTMIGDGSQCHEGRKLSVDKISQQCIGCKRTLGPLADCFDKNSSWCFVCSIIRESNCCRSKGTKRNRVADAQ